MAVRRSLIGESQESSRCAIVPDAYCKLMNATSGLAGRTQLRDIADDLGRRSRPSQKRRIEKSCGARSQTTLTSDWCRPRFTRLIEMK